MVRSAKDQFRAYLIDPTRLSGTLPLPPQKTSPGIGHTESAGDQATGVSPTRPAMGTLTSPPAAPPAAPAGRTQPGRPADAHRGGRSEERRVGKEGRSRWAPDH